jgi:microcystin-dependent protein
MGDLVVKPSYVLGPRDVLTVDKINLMATPVVELALEDPVNDQNFFRNGNFYSSFWKTPAGVNCPDGVWTTNANYWLCKPIGGAVTFLQSTTVPDVFSLFSSEIKGNANVGVVEYGQQINGDLSATLRRKCTSSGYCYNSTGLTISPTLNIYTCNAFNNFNSVTLQKTVNLQSCANASWTYMTATLDLSTVTNVANGLLITVLLPASSLNDPTKNVLFARLKFQIGEIATQFVDDTSLFVTSPSVDSTMLQDGCIARPSLFLPNVVPSGAYQPKSIKNPDIDDGAIDGRTLKAGAATGNLGYTPVNKAGDTGVGTVAHDVDTVAGANAALTAGVVVETTTTNANNDGYFPAIGFKRTGVINRAVGLAVDGRLKTIDNAGVVGYLLDSVHKVQTADIADGSITLAKLATSLVNLLIAPGTLHHFAGPTPPTGWLICDGSAVSRTTYAALYAAIGTLWGNGDNFSTFNLPDFRGRIPLGYVNSVGSGLTARAFAAKGGEENHVLTTAELAQHAHGVSDGGHAHGITDPGHQHTYGGGNQTVFNAQPGSTTIYRNDPNQPTSRNATAISIVTAVTNIGIQAAGSNGAHNTMPPFGVVYIIIKT